MHFLCLSSELPEGRSRGFEVAGNKLLGVRRHGQVYLYRNRCPHRGIPLNWEPGDSVLDATASLLSCAHHGALFLVESGECISGPCEGDALEALECHEDHQGIWLTA